MGRAAVIGAFAGLLVTAGCQDPYARNYADDRRNVAEPGVAVAGDVGHDTPQSGRTPHPVPVPNARDIATARAVVRAFCLQWSNWDWRTIDRQQARLASLAADPFARMLAREARRGGRDPAIRREQLGTTGRVASVDIRPGGSSRTAVCVARERPMGSEGSELEDTRYRVYLAVVVRHRGRWGVSSWEPQP